MRDDGNEYMDYGLCVMLVQWHMIDFDVVAITHCSVINFALEVIAFSYVSLLFVESSIALMALIALI